MQRVNNISIFLIGTIFLVGCTVEPFLNKTRVSPPYKVSSNALALHKRLTVVDLHADSLLWNRNLLKRGSSGHVDVPRLMEANVCFQVFGVVTKVPWRGDPDNNPGTSDIIGLNSMIQCWPSRTWNSLLGRALYQSEKLENLIKDSKGNLFFIKNREELKELLAKKQKGEKVIGFTLGLEGVHALEGELSNLDKLYDAGFRMIGLAHRFDNKAGGSSDGVKKGGLSNWGRELVQRIQAKNMILDLAHSSPKVIDDVLKITKKPVIVSHTGVRGTCNSQRNLSDKHIIGIAKTGGIIGLTAFKRAVGGESLADTVAAILYVKKLVGVEHVAIGFDFDGAVTTPVDVTGLPLLTQLLLKEGLTEKEIRKIMGENAINLMLKFLPEK